MFELPERLYVYNVGELIQMSKHAIGLGEDQIAIDAKALTYVDPAGLCTLGCILRKLDSLGISIELANSLRPPPRRKQAFPVSPPARASPLLHRIRKHLGVTLRDSDQTPRRA